jgi:lycopene beta-cyclase
MRGALRWVGAGALLAAAGGGLFASGPLAVALLAVMPPAALAFAFAGDLVAQRRRRFALASLPVALLALPSAWLGVDPAAATVAALGAAVTFATWLSTRSHPTFVRRAAALRDAVRGRPWRLALLGWAAFMIPTPLFPGAFVAFAYASTAFLTLAALLLALRYRARGALAFAVAFVFGVVIEAIGERTGIPFGAYVYTAPGPSIFGVPLLVPLGWFAFTLVAIAVAPAGRKRLLAPLALVAWDVGLDPLMVREGFWRFAEGPYFGVAYSNFVGWYLAGVLLVNLLLAIEPRLARDSLPDLRIAYVAQAALIGVGLAFFGLWQAGVIAAAAMLAVAGTSLWLERRRS